MLRVILGFAITMVGLAVLVKGATGDYTLDEIIGVMIMAIGGGLIWWGDADI